ncbi:alkaline phosphatase D family protein [Roseateles sp.]|uniref:alkaline phosphatase D family protein n=1 Tax=Roseateles sp. TaxID=1971397 RepID=UPI0032648B0A
MKNFNKPAAAGSEGALRLSRGLGHLWVEALEPRCFDVLIVGSGYGGSMAAAELAGQQVMEDGVLRPLRVGVLERGKEYLPGEFPSHFSELPGHLRLGQQETGRVGGKHEGLFDLRLGDDVAALLANGLGGGSLINAGVLLEPTLTDFAAGTALHALVAGLANGGFFARAKRMLGGTVTRAGQQLPNDISRHPKAGGNGLPKTLALSRLSTAKAELPPLSVAMDGEANDAQVQLKPCNLCGDCMTGCNVGAKDSLDANLLELARERGAEIYTGATVLSLRRANAKDAGWRGKRPWALRVAHTSPALQQREVRHLHLYAPVVILAAGTLGSSEILLRSRTDELLPSPLLGQQFSCNGDNIAAVAGLPADTQGCADEEVALDQRGVGPTITGSVGAIGAVSKRPFRIQEFSVPGALKPLFEELVTTARVIHEMPDPDEHRHGGEGDKAIDPLAVDDAAMRKTLLVGLIGHDDAAGSLHLPLPIRPRDRPVEQGTLRIRWPQARHAPLLEEAHAELAARVKRMGGQAQLIANPMWRLLPPKLERLVSQPRGPVLTVHPLGGCPMGNSAANGVVDEFGRVFDASKQPVPGDEPRLDGLLVLDGSIIPGSLGANPALTIAATALRAVEQLSEDQRYVARPAAPPAAPRPRRMLKVDGTRPHEPLRATEIEIVERLTGSVALKVDAEEEPYVVELSLAYEPVMPQALRTRLNRRVYVKEGAKSVIRLFRQDDWDNHGLRTASDAQRRQHIAFEARLGGQLSFLHREPSSPLWRRLRTVFPWLFNRGARDIWQEFADKSGRDSRQSFDDYAQDLWNMASRAGEVRRFDYVLTLGTISSKFPLQPAWQGGQITGSKRLTYNRRANPWHQLTRLSLASMPGLRMGFLSPAPVLELDTRFLATQGIALLRVSAQQDHARALLDLARFGLMWLRVLISIHLWTFRMPDKPSTQEPDRLPRRIKGLPDAPEVTELVVDRMPGAYEDARDDPRKAEHKDKPELIDFCTNGRDVPVKIRLTRYPSAKPGVKQPPLVMLHGYSVSGNTFTHESLAPSAAEFFCRQGREVWVVDLRTSTALATATYPWPMEDAGLIDIPAALLHIRNATGQKVDVLAHCIGCVMLSMALLTDPRDVRKGRTELSVDTWLTDEHLGTLAAFNGLQPLQDDTGHPCVNRIILSQKGPLLRYTDSNIFRAFLLQSMRRLLMHDSYQFRPPRDPKVMDQLLDRLLSSLPYPDADYDVENPLWPCKATPWVASRHRMDALYGRDFEAANLSDATLRAIDDLFGPINLDTVAQTIHFARFQAITNQRGRGEFVTRKRLRERWGAIPTMIIHGANNGLVDVATQDLLARHLREAGVRLISPPTDRAPYADMGHQDVLIGKDSARVFQDIEDFLLKVTLPERQTPPPDPLVFTLPWIGPRIALPNEQFALALACMSRPEQGAARLYLLPVSERHGVFTLGTDATAIVQSKAPGHSDQWLFANPPLSAPAASTGYLALMVHTRDDAMLGEDAWALAPPAAVSARTPMNAPPPNARPPTPTEVLDQAHRWLAAQAPDTPRDAYVSHTALVVAMQRHGATLPQYGARFALASCQYPAGLLDDPVAQVSLQRLADTAHGALPVGLALLVGDQVYADATAGLMDPTRRDERYDQPTQKALRASGMRSLLRSMPVQMLLDDHEIVDNWEPTPGAVEKVRPIDSLHNRLNWGFGFAAFRKYQRMSTHHGLPEFGDTADLAFNHAGFPFYLADTRSGRSPRGSKFAPGQQFIMSDARLQTLERWLLAQGNAVKFVACPSLLLPRRRQSGEDESSGADHSDAWDGFPASLERLLCFIAAHQISNTVFLSGDEHHSLVTEAIIELPGAKPVKLLSVHSSSLYAPFPFANGRPSELALDENFQQGALDVKVISHVAPSGDGFAMLHTDGMQLHVAFSRAGEATPRHFRSVGLR